MWHKTKAGIESLDRRTRDTQEAHLQADAEDGGVQLRGYDQTVGRGPEECQEAIQEG